MFFMAAALFLETYGQGAGPVVLAVSSLAHKLCCHLLSLNIMLGCSLAWIKKKSPDIYVYSTSTSILIQGS